MLINIISSLAIVMATRHDVLMIAVDDLRPQLECFDMPGAIKPPMRTLF